MGRAKDIEIVPGEYYHLYGRGVRKNKLFLDKRDYVRFLFLLTHFQSDEPLYNVSSIVTSFNKKGAFPISQKKLDKVIKKRMVEVVAFCLMPNHYHILIKGCVEGGISLYMKRILGGYAQYFNTKYKMSGHVFQGSYNAVHISNNEQLLHTSAYIHRNPRELKEWRGKEDGYPWSSYDDYVDANRWGDLLATDIVLDQFKSPKEYSVYVHSHTTKE